MPLLFRTHLELAKNSLKRNRTRAFLTCIGIAIGTASIVLILSLTGSIKQLITSQVNNIGKDLIIVRPTSKKSQIDNIVSELTASNQFIKSNLSISDIDTINSLPEVSTSAPISISSYTLKAEKTVDSGTVVGTTPSLQTILGANLRSGSFLSDTNESNLSTAVIGRELSLQLFGNSEPIGKVFTLLNHKFIVIGLLDPTDEPINFNNINFNTAVLVNIKNLINIDPTDSTNQYQI